MHRNFPYEAIVSMIHVAGKIEVYLEEFDPATFECQNDTYQMADYAKFVSFTRDGMYFKLYTDSEYGDGGICSGSVTVPYETMESFVKSRAGGQAISYEFHDDSPVVAELLRAYQRRIADSIAALWARIAKERTEQEQARVEHDTSERAEYERLKLKYEGARP